MKAFQFKDVRSASPPSLVRVNARKFRLCLLICLAACSLSVSADRVEGESDAGGYAYGLNTDSRGRSTSAAGTMTDDSGSETATKECTTNRRKENAGGVEQRHTASLYSLISNARDPKTFSCLSSAQQVRGMWNKGKLLLIDLRRGDEFEKYHIPGSLNLPPFAIQSKAFLKERHLVLLNEGRRLWQLESLCSQLKSRGFQVDVMEGGLYAWYRNGFPVTGERFELSKLDQLSPADFVFSLAERDWKYIDLDQSLASLKDLFPPSAVIEYQRKKQNDFIKAVNRASGEFNENALSGFIVISSNGGGYKSVAPLLLLSEAKNVFYLAGGIDEFTRYLDMQARQFSRLTRGFKEPHRCSG